MVATVKISFTGAVHFLNINGICPNMKSYGSYCIIRSVTCAVGWGGGYINNSHDAICS